MGLRVATEATPREPKAGETARFLVLYREPMAYGMPIGVAVFSPVVAFVVLATTENLLFALAAFALIVLSVRLATAHDVNFIRILHLMAITRWEARNVARWGGASWSPLPTTPALTAKQVPVRGPF